MRLYFIRHGESEANVLQEISNSALKYGLTEKGRLQAQERAQYLAGIPFARIFTSPILRAVQTAEIISRSLAVSVETTEALREFSSGVIEGKSDEASWKLLFQTWEAWMLRNEWGRRIQGGESFLDLRARFEPFLESLVGQFGSTSANLLLVSHGGLLKCMLPLVCANLTFAQVWDLPASNTGLFLVEQQPGGLICLEWEGQPMNASGPASARG